MLSYLGLCDFLAKLDQRYEAKVKKDGTFMARKVRCIGTPSTSEPPPSAPEWTIDPEWKEMHEDSGKHIFGFVHV